MPHGTFLDPERNGRTGSGIVVDGAVYQLEGQPPVAQSHGWGNMTWLAWAKLTGVRQFGS